MFRRLALPFAALLSVVSAQLMISSPGTNDWWVASSLNIITWTCSTSPYLSFTILLANSNPLVLVAPFALIAVQENNDCSEGITQQQSAQPAGTGYTIQFASTLNSSDIYAQSEPFEIKALGAPYDTITGSAGSTSTGTVSGSAGTTGGALAEYVPVGMSMVAALVLGLVVVQFHFLDLEYIYPFGLVTSLGGKCFVFSVYGDGFYFSVLDFSCYFIRYSALVVIQWIALRT
ncbi:hypothetical protein EDB19DRAFT_1639953 [Suillus lakei]|nr:hypothetical protein EDB19DRAFT_1639953 [Suillus lakei]